MILCGMLYATACSGVTYMGVQNPSLYVMPKQHNKNAIALLLASLCTKTVPILDTSFDEKNTTRFSKTLRWIA